MTSEQLAKILDELQNRLGPAGGVLWRSAVTKTLVGAWAPIIFCTALALVLLPLGIWGVRIRSAYRRQNGMETMWADSSATGFEWIAAGAMLAGGLAAFFALVALVSGLSTIAAPEYSALRDMLQAFGGK